MYHADTLGMLAEEEDDGSVVGAAEAISREFSPDPSAHVDAPNLMLICDAVRAWLPCADTLDMLAGRTTTSAAPRGARLQFATLCVASRWRRQLSPLTHRVPYKRHCADTLDMLAEEEDDDFVDAEADEAEPQPEPEAPAYPDPPIRQYSLGDLLQVGCWGRCSWTLCCIGCIVLHSVLGADAGWAARPVAGGSPQMACGKVGVRGNDFF